MSGIHLMPVEFVPAGDPRAQCGAPLVWGRSISLAGTPAAGGFSATCETCGTRWANFTAPPMSCPAPRGGFRRERGLRELLVDCDSLLGLMAHRRVTEETKAEAQELSWRCRRAYEAMPTEPRTEPSQTVAEPTGGQTPTHAKEEEALQAARVAIEQVEIAAGDVIAHIERRTRALPPVSPEAVAVFRLRRALLNAKAVREGTE